MKTNLIRSSRIAAGIALLGLTGCVAIAPQLDTSFGSSVNAIKLQQTIDPSASSNTRAATLDGRAAKEALGRYTESYKTPPPQANVFTIGVGGK